MKSVQFKSPEETIETLRLATEAACLGVWDLNVDSGELHWSDRTKVMFGVSASGPVTLAEFSERLHPEDKDRVLAAVYGAMDPQGPGEYDTEYRVIRPNREERFFSAKGKAFFEEIAGERKATRFVGTLLDRTDQMLAQAALGQAEKLAATGRLAASIAHEISNPLEAVTNLLYLLRDEPDEEVRRVHLRQAESELARVSEIASNTLRFYRDPRGPSRVGLKPLIDSVLGLVQGRIVIRGIELEYVCAEDAEVNTSQGELRQVILNLIGNALDAMPEGGKLRVHCRAFPKAVGDRKPGVRLWIADTGSGMSPEVLQRAFEPFYTTKGSAGTGIGLWLSKEIVKKHGFKLSVRSKPRRGTVFGLYMPMEPQIMPMGQ